MLDFCDYIAKRIKESLDTPESLLSRPGPIEMDLHETEGWLQSTTKTIEILDNQNKLYRITVESLG